MQKPDYLCATAYEFTTLDDEKILGVCVLNRPEADGHEKVILYIAPDGRCFMPGLIKSAQRVSKLGEFELDVGKPPHWSDYDINHGSHRDIRISA